MFRIDGFNQAKLDEQYRYYVPFQCLRISFHSNLNSNYTWQQFPETSCWKGRCCKKPYTKSLSKDFYRILESHHEIFIEKNHEIQTEKVNTLACDPGHAKFKFVLLQCCLPLKVKCKKPLQSCWNMSLLKLAQSPTWNVTHLGHLKLKQLQHITIF